MGAVVTGNVLKWRTAAAARMATACQYVVVPFTTASPASSTRSIDDAIFGKPSSLALTDNRTSVDPAARQASPLLAPCYDFFYF
jgi:hypothetical protein